jgi:hypothetical protein
LNDHFLITNSVLSREKLTFRFLYFDIVDILIMNPKDICKTRVKKNMKMFRVDIENFYYRDGLNCIHLIEISLGLFAMQFLLRSLRAF